MVTEMVDLQNPEYTGENRCNACTLVNLCIAFLLALPLVMFSLLMSIFVAISFISLIYFRGYIIPGTPEITKKYFPDWLLRQFGKNTKTLDDKLEDDSIVDEELLFKLDIVDTEGDDIDIEDEFRREWEREMKITSRKNIKRLIMVSMSQITSINTDDLSFAQTESSEWVVMKNGQPISKWISKEGIIIDISSINILMEQCTEWGQLSLQEKSRVVNSLRTLVQLCPSCGGNILLNKTHQETCCTSVEIIEVKCDDCGMMIDTIENN